MAKVPPDLVAAAQKDFKSLGKNSVVGDVDKYLAAFTGSAPPYLAVDTRPLAARSNPFFAKALTPYVAWKVASLVSWLFVKLPVGDPLRAGIPKIVTGLRKILDDKRNLWELESRYFEDDKPAQRAKRHADLTALVGGKPVEAPKEGAWTQGRDDGTLWLGPAALASTSRDATVHGAFYTAKLDGSTVDRIRAFAHAASAWEKSEVIPTAEHIRSDGFAALGARVAKTDVPAGSWEANPLVSAKALVAKVAAGSDVSQDAAALLLQTLALPEPTKANVLLWNQWGSPQYDSAAAELVKRKLVVQASVPGAGRKIFGLGTIVKKTKLNLPIEASKTSGNLVTHGRYVKHLVTEPCHSLFERAWAQRG